MNAIYFSSSGSAIVSSRSLRNSYPQWPSEVWAWKNLAGDCTFLILHFFIDISIICLIENNAFSCLSSYFKKAIPPVNQDL
jgi:ATP-binding cassette, subfamily A (ABC1), member 3